MEDDKFLQPVEEDLVKALLEETDSDKTKNLMNIFNLNFAKKNAIRLESISDLLDDVLLKVGERLQKRPDEFSNKDLIDYLNALYQAAEKSSKIVGGAEEIPAITLNQQNNVIVSTTDGLTRESRMKIAAAVAAILNQTQLKEGEIRENADNEESDS